MLSGELVNREVLLVDCQTTGSSPKNGNLLELAWARYAAGDDALDPREVSSSLVRLPSGESVPRAITRLTGITDSDVLQAPAGEDVWARFAQSIGEPETPLPVFAVAHFARFEEQFLRALHASAQREAQFPLQFICTHEIARRLQPDLPRRSLRALAGFFGHSLPELKRAAPHISATAVVWRHVVETLDEEHGISTVKELLHFLAKPPPTRAPRWHYPLPRDKRLSLPKGPGVYRFKGGTGDVLYVGKATSLHHRVNSYYRKRKAGEKTLELVSQVKDIDVISTETSLEAALLEAGEIRRLSPRYNRALRDDGQGIWFFSRDLRRRSRHPEPDLFEGPIPAKEPVDGLVAIAHLLGKNAKSLTQGAALLSVLGIPQKTIEPMVIHEGLRLFQRTHHPTCDPMRTRGLLAVGTSLRRQKNQAAEPDQVEEATSPPENAVAHEKRLDPEGFAKILEGIVEHAAILLRRGRWLRLLSESCIAWELSSADDEGERRLLVVQNATVASASFLDAHQAVPSPQSGHIPLRQRSRAFDRATYDRQRVLNTELKRLVSEGRNVEIVLSPRHRFTTENLHAFLPTV